MTGDPMKQLILGGAAVSLVACAPVIEPQPTVGLPAGYPKTLVATITPWFTVVGNERVTHNASGAQQTQAATATGSAYVLPLANSQNLPAGQVVDFTWRANYAPILFPFGAANVEESGSFTVGPAPSLRLDRTSYCVRRNEAAPVEVELSPAPPSGTSFNVNLSTNPASVALPQATPIVVGPTGNTVNVNGIAVGESTLTASAVGLPAPATDTATIRVIEPLAVPVLQEPLNGATDVFFGSQPAANASTISVRLAWNEVPGALSSTQKYIIDVVRLDGTPVLQTNSSAPDIVLAFAPATTFRWRVQALFSNCPSGTTYGPFSAERTFTTFGEQGS
jgi:hypothetical protein